MPDSLTSFIAALGPYAWFVAGLALMALEVVAPGTLLLWFGIAALATGVATLAFSLSVTGQFLVFALAAAASLAAWWRFRRHVAEGPGDPVLNQRAGRHAGRRFTLAEPIVSGVGRVRIDDTVWRVQGPDCPAGTEVEVVGADGGTLVVRPPNVTST